MNEQNTQTNSRTIKDAHEAFLSRCTALNLADGTLAWYENILRDLHRAYFLAPEQQAASERSAEPTPSGVRIESERCGYESLLLAISQQ